MINYKCINGIEDMMELISEQDFDKKIGRNRSSFLYRGMPNKDFELVTSLRRNCKNKQYELEKSILRNFTKYATIEDSELHESVWRQLIIGQHHGLPTRLLDWTYSPLIGLHFATSGENLSQMEEHDAVIWKIDINEMNSKLPNTYKEMLKNEGAYLFTVNMLNALAGDIEQYDSDMGKRSMVLIEPPSIDQRIINQYSYFSIIPKEIENIERFLDENTDNTVKYVINKNFKWRIRDFLDQMNINERIAYPGLDGLTMWLKRHYFVR